MNAIRHRFRLDHTGTAGLTLALVLLPACLRAEDGSAAWLRYAPISNSGLYDALPSRIAVLGNTPTEDAAGRELQKGLSSMLGRPFKLLSHEESTANIGNDSIVLASFKESSNLDVVRGKLDWQPEQYRISLTSKGGVTRLAIFGGTPQAELYGVFHLLEEVASERTIPAFEQQSPAAPIRWTDEWDNLNGTIERGYAGPSIFFEDGHVRRELLRAGEYAKLLASVGINGCNINNVNADLDTLSSEHLREFARIADAFRPWGVSLR